MKDLVIEARSHARSDEEWDQEWRERLMDLTATILIFTCGNREFAKGFVDKILAPNLHELIDTAQVTAHPTQ